MLLALRWAYPLFWETSLEYVRVTRDYAFKFVLEYNSKFEMALDKKIRLIMRRLELWNASIFWKSDSTTFQLFDPYNSAYLTMLL